MQTLGLTMATAASDAGADSALQTNAASSPDAGALFQTLMTAAGEPPNENMATADAGAPDVSVSPIPADAPSLDRATQTLTSDLATDMEQMVQALAITAEVVAQGMAARTTPVREIILTVEPPTTDLAANPALPQLSVVVPTASEIGPSLKISDADPEKNLDPALVALMPPLPKTSSVTPQEDELALAATELDTVETDTMAQSTAIVETALLQAPSHLIEEPYGPWRAEIHGPVLNAQRDLITLPVHVPLFESPETSKSLAAATETNTVPEIGPAWPSTTLTESQNTITNMPIRMSAIHVPVKADILPETGWVDLAETNVSTTHSEPTDSSSSDILQPTQMIVSSAEFIGPQILPMANADLERATSTLSEKEAVEDALNTPRSTTSQAHVLLVAATRAETMNLRLTNPPVLTQPAVATPGIASEVPAFDVAAVVDALHRDADLSRAAHRQAVDVRNYESLLETNIANPVAKTSSRSSNDIRDLMKLGIRDIEIVQGSGTQIMNVSPQMQTIELTDASAAARAQVADAFAPTGNESNAADRRAQAHEIRMRAIERQVVAAVRDGADTIRMQLYPPGLGQIIIRLTMDGSKLKLSTSAHSSDAADSLRSIEGDLRDALSVGGLELTGFDVSEDGDGGNKDRKNTSETENNTQQSRSAKSDDFALDMNA